MQGNCYSLTISLCYYFGRPDVQIAYFGSDLLKDVIATREWQDENKLNGYTHAHWDSFALIDEFDTVDKSFRHGEDPLRMEFNEYFWGPSFFFHENPRSES